MWLFVAYDLPVISANERRNAVRFHKALKRLGFDRFQLSLYRKFCGSHARLDRLSRLVVQAVPPRGNVAVFPMTDKQVARMILYENRRKKTGDATPEQLLLL